MGWWSSCRVITSRACSPSGYPTRTAIAKRSSWPSGSGYVPWCSTGFSVAIRKKGSGSRRVTPSTVTCRSSMGSRRADWVRGVARLTSSTKTTFAKIGPGTNSNSRRSWW